MKDILRQNVNNKAEVEPAGSTSFDAQIVTHVLTGAWRRHRLAFSLALILSLGSAVFLSKIFATQVWKATSVLLYAGPTVPDSEQGLQSALSLNNLAGLAASRPVLKRVRSDLGLSCPIDMMEEAVDVEQERNTSSVFIAVEWDDRKQAVNMLQRITAIYPRSVAETRRNIAETRLTETERQLANCRSRLGQSRDRLQTFMRTHNVLDFRQDQLQLQTDVGGLRFARERFKRDQVSMREQVRMLDEHIESLKREHAEEEREAKQFEAAEESLADNRRRQHRLRELILDERFAIEVNAQLVVKRREYERARRLAQRQLISQSKLERIRGELESLIAKITENQNIKQWKRELLELDKLVVPKNKVSKTGSPIIHQILFKRLEISLDILHGEKAVLEIDRQLDSKQRLIAQIQQLTTEYASLEDEVDAVDDERQAFVESAASLRALAELGPTEFLSISPPTTGEFPARTNRKKLFVLILFVSTVSSFVAIVWRDVARFGLIPTATQLTHSGLPMLGELPQFESIAMTTPKQSAKARMHQERTRDFALRLRQFLNESGDVALIASFNENQPLRRLLEGLANCLTARDERVLVIDARRAADGMGELVELVETQTFATRLCDADDVTGEDAHIPALADWLAFRYDSLSEITLATRIAGVDVILPGVTVSVEEIATVRMSQLINEVRERYSLVLLLGPATSQSTDLQILASHASGIVFTFRPQDRIDKASQKTVMALNKMQAPILGVVAV